MTYNTVPNGSYLYQADWDSIGSHFHTGTARDGVLLNFSGCFVAGDKVANSKITNLTDATDPGDACSKGYVDTYIGSLVTSSAWAVPNYLLPTRYTVYDNFDSYGATGSFTDPSNKWDFDAGITTAAIVNTQLTGGSYCEMQVATASSSGEKDGILGTSALTANKHTWMRTYLTHSMNNPTTPNTILSRFGKSGAFINILDTTQYGGAITSNSNLMVINTGTGSYDMYIGGKVTSYKGINDGSAQIEVKLIATRAAGTTTTSIYIDDVRQW
jgi:hypothetical protein